MKKPLLFVTLLSIIAGNGFAQQHRTCTTHDRYLQAIAADPSIVQRRAQLEQESQNWINANQARLAPNSQAQVVVTIPVVIHVLYYNATQNISTAQINSQIVVLNKDYSRTNTDAANTPSAFQSIAVNCDMQFCLATVDPNGNPTTGIETRSTTINQIGNTNSYYQYSAGGLNAWDRTKYLNIWVCNIDGGNTLGYAYLPGTAAASYDGVVIDYRYFGTMGTVSAPFNLGRTATHEVGHWFNLEHIWADEPSCSADDGVTDTPQQKGENYGCPAYPQTTQSGGRCNTSDPSSMFMNYMDYTDDNCMNAFTQGQKTRMLAAINGARSGLLTSNGCGPAGITPVFGELSVSVFPNPSNGQVELLLGASQNKVDVVLMNTMGEVVSRLSFEHIERTEIDLTAYAKGIYIAEISTGTARAVRKLVIE